jgi:hypothetical protein
MQPGGAGLVAMIPDKRVGMVLSGGQRGRRLGC